MRNRLIVALFGVPSILIVLLVLPAVWTPIMVSLLAIVASFEISRAFGVTQLRLRLYAMLLAAAIPQCVYWKATALVFLCALFLVVLLSFVEALISQYKVNMSAVGGIFFFTFFVSFFLSSVVRLVMGEGRAYYILVPLIIPFMSDTAAMFSGMFFGKHKLAPSISPKKTVEGSLGGLVGAILSILLYGLIIWLVLKPEVNYLYLAIYALFGAAVSQVGDLAFSYVKRQNKIKDFGTIFPGHGGVLDRFDSVIFCAPFVEILILLIPAFQFS